MNIDGLIVTKFIMGYLASLAQFSFCTFQMNVNVNVLGQ